MNRSSTKVRRKSTRTAERARSRVALSGGIRYGGVSGMRREGGRRRKKFGNGLFGSLGLGALQPIEIPQNRQNFLWKCLERNMRDLEKLAKKLGGRLDSAAFSLRRRGRAGLPRSRQPSTG